MIEEKELLSAIQDRSEALLDSCNSHHINHQQGVLRGLVWAYIGEDPGVIDSPEELNKLIASAKV